MPYALLRPLLFSMNPEQAHEKTLQMLESANKAHLLGFVYAKQALPTECMGISLLNPVGLAAGLDKNGAYIDALSELGFGFWKLVRSPQSLKWVTTNLVYSASKKRTVLLIEWDLIIMAWM